VTAKTRRRLIVGLVVVALTLPIESILLHALSTTDSQAVAASWVGSLSATDLTGAAAQVEAYPFGYRREIMRALSPAQRSAVWQSHIQRYIAAHPNLDISTAALLYNAASLATPDAFSRPTDDVRSAIGVIAEQTKILLGKSEADYLFYRLGPPDNTFATAEPIAQKLTNMVRDFFTVQARADDCDCSTDFGCDGQGTRCGSGTSCNRDESWPMCGWFWDQVCDGLCVAGLGGS